MTCTKYTLNRTEQKIFTFALESPLHICLFLSISQTDYITSRWLCCAAWSFVLETNKQKKKHLNKITYRCGVGILIHALNGNLKECELLLFFSYINSMFIVEPKCIFSMLSCLHSDIMLPRTPNTQNSCMYSMISVSEDECPHAN